MRLGLSPPPSTPTHVRSIHVAGTVTRTRPSTTSTPQFPGALPPGRRAYFRARTDRLAGTTTLTAAGCIASSSHGAKRQACLMHDTSGDALSPRGLLV